MNSTTTRSTATAEPEDTYEVTDDDKPVRYSYCSNISLKYVNM